MRHNSVVLGTCAEVMKVTNHTGLEDTQYSLSVSHRSLEHSLGIHPFLFAWPCPILEPNFFNHLFTVLWLTASSPSRTTNGCFRVVRTKFELAKHKFAILKYVACSPMQLSKHTGVKQCTTCQRTNYHDISNHSVYLFTARTASVTWCTRRKLECMKILQNFWLKLVAIVTWYPTETMEVGGLLSSRLN